MADLSMHRRLYRLYRLYRRVCGVVSSARVGVPLALVLTLTLSGCASTAPVLASGSAMALPAAVWQAEVPHGGQVSDLRRWWSQFGDPLLLHLIEAAQQASPTLARATANIADARAVRVSSGAALRPSLEVGGSATRMRPDLAAPVGTMLSAGLQASWALDVSGAGRAGSRAATARLASSEAGWHDARVSVAAEVARHYVELRACEAQVQQAQKDASSHAQTAHLTDLAVRAGMRSPVLADLTRASAAQSEVTWVRQRAQCERLLKALVALSAQDEQWLRRELAVNAARRPEPLELHIGAVPADVLAQRPDVHAAAQEVLAASADSEQVTASRWPRITLSGSIGATRFSSMGVSADGAVWSVGPVAITFPLFDGGVRRASEQAAQLRHDAAKQVYAARLREAIQEVEAALVTLDSTARRTESAQVAAAGFERAYRATAISHQAGWASLFDLEDARRGMVSAQGTLIDLHRERVLAWIALYRSVGGGWSAMATDSRN